MKIPRSANNDVSGSLADRIRTTRKRAALSQTKLAGMIGVSASAVAQWEHPRGTRPSFENLFRIVDVTGAPLEWLMVGGNNRRTSKPGRSEETPAVSFEIYARTLQEETLLERFREIPTRRRPLLIAIAEEFAISSRISVAKKR